MKNLLEIDHIGYAVRDIQETAAPYVAAGWDLSEVYNEEVQHAKIAFLKKEGMMTIELVAPLSEGGGAPVEKILRSQGVALYHICYVVKDIMEAVEALHQEDFMPLFWPVPSIAMHNKQICYLYNKSVGLIEIVEK